MSKKGKVRAQKGKQVQSETDRLLAEVESLPSPADYLAEVSAGSLAIVGKVHHLILGHLPRGNIEDILKAGRDDITPEMVVAAAALLRQQLKQYQWRVSEVIVQAEESYRAMLGQLQERGGAVEAEREQFFGVVDASAGEYQELLNQIAQIEGYFEPEFKAAAEAAATKGAAQKRRWAPVGKFLAGLGQQAANLFTYEVGSEEGADEEAQTVQDIRAIVAYLDPEIKITREAVLESIQEVAGWSPTQMVEIVTEAKAVFSERLAGARSLRAEQSGQFQQLLSRIEGSIAAAEGALKSLEQKREEIASAVGELEVQIAAVQETFPA